MANSFPKSWYWQMPNPNHALALVRVGALRMVGDLVIHPDAAETLPGESYTMPNPNP
jgi:hypothetical protein